MSTIGVGTRPSDAERDRALAVLRDGAGSGRLSHDTFIRRMNVVLRARTTGELADVLRDLPTKESRLKAWTRTVRSKLPRLTFTHSPSNQAPATRSAPDGPATPGGLDAGGLPGGPDGPGRPGRLDGYEARGGLDGRAVVGRRRSWLDSVPRLTVVREVAAPPPPGLALPAPGSPTVRIGRGPGATLRFGDETVSRCHAELRYVDDGWMLRDLGSMNGTCVNDQRITTTVQVRPGDRVSFGAVTFTLTYES